MTKVTLTGKTTLDNGIVVEVTKETTVDYSYAIVLVNEETGEIKDAKFTKSYLNVDFQEAKMAREWGFWNQHTAPIYVVKMNKPSKFRILNHFTPEQIALIEQTLGMEVKTDEIKNAAI